MDIEKSKRKAREIYEKTYIDRADIKIYDTKIVNGITKTNLKTIYSDIPCKLCFSSGVPVSQNIKGEIDNRVVIMISPDINIPKNSQIIVTKENQEYIYINSNSIKFTTHQAVFLRYIETKS